MPAIVTRIPRPTMPTRVAASTTPPVHDRWIRGAGTPYPVLDLLVADGWTLVLDDLADVHCASPDGHVYLGYLAESPRPHPDDVWHLSVEPGNGMPGWEQTFHADVPAEVIAGFVRALITTEHRPDIEPF